MSYYEDPYKFRQIPRPMPETMTSKKMMKQLDEIITASRACAVREREDGNDRAADGYSEFYRKLKTARDVLVFKVPSE